MKREPLLSLVLRALVHGIAAAVFTWPLSRGAGVLAAAFGAIAGAVLGPRIARTELRTPVLVGAALAAGTLLSFFVRFLFLDTSLFAGWLGPATALRTGDAAFFFCLALMLSTVLRALSARRRSYGVLEVAAVGLAFAQLVVAHRHGAINRPFELADPILAAGGDPSQVFMVLGAAATAVVVLLLLSEQRPLRTLFHLAAVALLLVLFLGTSSVIKMPEPPPPEDGLGLRQQEREEEEQDSSQGAGGGNRQNEDELEFRDQLDTSNSRFPVGVVLFHDDYSPPYGVYYFRQGAFSQYNGRRLVAAVGSDLDRDIGREFPTSPYDVSGAPAVNANRATIDTTVALLADHTRPFGLEAPIRFEPAPNPNPNRFRRTYRVSSAVLTADFASMIGARAGSIAWGQETWNHYVRAPEDPRYAELAERILRERLSTSDLDSDPAARVAAITSWLGEVGIYSLQSRHAGAEDPTADFLFGDRTGYCVHFAHAATYLLRASGVPARVATGYAIEESARQGGSALLVSGEASHAWPEVYFEGYGWVVADVSPQTIISPPPSPPDPDLQRLLGELARGLEPVPPDPDSPVSEAIDWIRTFFVVLGYTLLALIPLALLFLGVVKVWRAVAWRFAPPRDQPRVVYRAALDRLSELQLRRDRGESREAFARRVRSVAPSFEELTATHVGAAFGSRMALGKADGMPRIFEQLRSELARATPPHRRVLGLLAPWSWLTSR
ncbi:MAG: transglutaminase domain-containing protein [Myxococcota bacterium]